MNTGPADSTPDRDGGCEGNSAQLRQRGAGRPEANMAAKIANVANFFTGSRSASASGLAPSGAGGEDDTYSVRTMVRLPLNHSLEAPFGRYYHQRAGAGLDPTLARTGKFNRNWQERSTPHDPQSA